MMKKYVRSTKTIDTEKDVVLLVDMMIIEDSINSSRITIQDPKGISKSQKLSIEQKRLYQSVVDNVYDILFYEFDFYEDESHQSESTYSSYFTFLPTDYEGKSFSKRVRVQLRLSDHDTVRNIGQVDTDFLRMSILFNRNELDNVDDLYNQIRSICNELKYGDYDSID